MRRLALSFLLAVFVGGCAVTGGPVPHTPREKYAAAEATYGAVVTTVDQLAAAGQLEKGTPDARSVAASLRTARLALDAWGATPDDVSRQRTALLALGTLQRLLVELQRRLP